MKIGGYCNLNFRVSVVIDYANTQILAKNRGWKYLTTVPLRQMVIEYGIIQLSCVQVHDDCERPGRGVLLIPSWLLARCQLPYVLPLCEQCLNWEETYYEIVLVCRIFYICMSFLDLSCNSADQDWLDLRLLVTWAAVKLKIFTKCTFWWKYTVRNKLC